MNLRHAVALAIVGWYLMVPLPGNDPIPNAGVHSFLKWIHLQSFDTAAECEDGRINLIGLGIVPNIGAYDATEQKKVLLLSQCVASNDPRLKEK
jgi:hypothetical protein